MKSILIFASVIWSLTLVAQNDPVFPTNEEEFNKLYQRNILKTKINGVYIPQDEEEAFNQITRLSEEGSWDKFKSGPEELVVTKLKLGLGRWMEVNWNFHEGSRLSHYLKEKGILHPEDMSKYLMIFFHRKLNDKVLDEKLVIDNLVAERKKKVRSEVDDYNTSISPITKEK